MADFPCIKCGLCCRKIEIAVQATKEIEGMPEFPYKWDETGKCEMLDENEMCKVYDNRPLLCSVDRMMNKFGIDKTLFYNLNIQSCNKILEEAGRPERLNSIS